jgi:hypothetical protein
VVLAWPPGSCSRIVAIRYERGQTLMSMMMRGVEHDIASSVAILNARR